MQPLPQGRMPLPYSVQQQQAHYSNYHESSYPASQVYAHSPTNYQPPPTPAPLQQLGIQAQIAVQPMHHHHPQNVNLNGYGQTHGHSQYMSPTTPTSHIHHQQQPQQHIYRQSHETPQHGHWNQTPRYQPHPVSSPIHLSPLDAYLLARALQTAPPQQEAQQIILFAQVNGKEANILLRAYEQNRREIDQLVAQLRAEEAALIAQHQQTSPQISPAPAPPSSQPAAMSTPTSAPPTQQTFKREQSSTDLASEASSPMLETPTSASLPTATKPGSRDGEPYSEAEIRLIEQVIREAVQKQPDIKLAQLGVLIHQKDQARPATAWARQLSKRKQAIDRARELSKGGKDISRYPIEVNRKGRQHIETDTDGEGSPSKAADDAEYDDRPHKRRRAS